MVKLRNLTQRYAIVFAAALTVSVYFISRFFNYFIVLIPDLYVEDVVFNIVFMLWPVALTFLFGYGFVFKEKGFGKTFKTGLLFLCVYLAVLPFTALTAFEKAGAQWQTWDKILLGVLTLIGIGLREELLFRGIIGNALALKYAKSTKGIWLTVAVASIAFGALHFFNVLAGVSVGAVFVQVLGATVAGAVFCAIYLRGGNVWVPIIIHAVVDLVGLFESTFVISAVSDVDQINNLNFSGLLVSIPLELLLIAFLLRKSKRQDILDRFETLREKYGENA